MNCTWDDWWFFCLNGLGGSLVGWTSDVKAVWVNLKGGRIRHSQCPCSSNPGKHVLEPILPRGGIKCSAGFSTSQVAVVKHPDGNSFEEKGSIWLSAREFSSQAGSPSCGGFSKLVKMQDVDGQIRKRRTVNGAA